MESLRQRSAEGMWVSGKCFDGLITEIQTTGSSGMVFCRRSFSVECIICYSHQVGLVTGEPALEG